MKKIKVNSFRNFWEKLLFEVLFQGIIFIIFIIGLAYFIDKNPKASLVAVPIFGVLGFLFIFFKLFNNAILVIKPEGLLIKRFNRKAETIEWHEISVASFNKYMYDKKFLMKVELNLKLVNNKDITISLEKFIGQGRPRASYMKLKRNLPPNFIFRDIEEIEPDKRK